MMTILWLIKSFQEHDWSYDWYSATIITIMWVTVDFILIGTLTGFIK